ncbi:MAG: hypothetical protein ACI9OH_000118 [Oleispira sp.]|jgi:hypothetical protein
MATHLFLASTPFNMLTSAMVALDLPVGDEAYLGIIDQPETERTFVTTLYLWKESPFKQTLLLSLQAKGKGKRKKRQSALNKIAQLIDQIKPDKIYTGNDRRIEFQFAMHHSRKTNELSMGVYIDDGTYSYLGRKTHWLTDRIVDNLIKKLSYGSWWQQPSTIGASNWISQAILAFPESAIEALKTKRCLSLPENLHRDEFKRLAELCLELFKYPKSQIQHIDALIMLPHESVVSVQTKKKLSYWLSNQDAKISFKHHPRTVLSDTTGDKELWLIPDRAEQVPAGIPMEVLLPLIKSSCQIAGDVSTALLTAKWLRPELKVTAFITDKTSVQWLNLLDLLHIQVETA